MPPAELLDRILDETAYAFEWKGPRLVQARENVKKVRGLIRRIQNRGYLTLARLADFVDRLSAGDESNAVVDALNAVNLMTVHASKGLEFPIVFVVNLEQGTGGQTDPIRVSAHGEANDAVAVGDFHAEFDDDAANRDTEETKRLLYVAVTRGRDRLYLSAVTKDGRLRPGRGSLAAVCPVAVQELFGRAAAAAEGTRSLEWRTASGHRHVIAVCPPGVAPTSVVGESDVNVEDPGAPSAGEDYGALPDPGASTRLAVTAPSSSTRRASRKGGGAETDRLLAGRLVHRLFQCGGDTIDEDDGGALAPEGGPRAWSREDWGRRAARLIGDDERYASVDMDQVVEDAVDLFLRLRARDDVRRVLANATCFYEVPFSLWLDSADLPLAVSLGAGPVLVRGVIDCLAQMPSGDVVVLDFKTGTPHPADEGQMRVYVDAARRAFPEVAVTGSLVYGTAGASGEPPLPGGE